MLPSLAMILSRSIVSVLPTTSSKKTGRYFSTLILVSVMGLGAVQPSIPTKGDHQQLLRDLEFLELLPPTTLPLPSSASKWVIGEHLMSRAGRVDATYRTAFVARALQRVHGKVS